MRANVFTNSTECPHCGAKCRSIWTRQITSLAREVMYDCPDCEFTFVAQIAPVRAIHPSNRPNPDVHIPVLRLA